MFTINTDGMLIVRQQEPVFVNNTAMILNWAQGMFVHARSDRPEVQIDDLGDSRLFLKKTISVIVEDIGDGEVMAVFAETGIAMSGDSYSDAVSALKAQIAGAYLLYKGEPGLGPEPRRRLKILERHIAETGRK